MNHADEMACLLYLDGQLDRVRAAELSAHAEQCADCRRLLRALERESRLLTRALAEEDEPIPARLLDVSGRTSGSLRWAWLTSFGLAATGVYALWTGYIEPWQQQLEQAGFNGTNLLNLLLFQGAFWKGWQSMISFIELTALVVVGGIGLGLLRRRFRRWTALAMVVTSLLAALSMPSPASAAEYRKADSVVVQKDEIVKNDLIFVGGLGRIDGTVDGDVVSFGDTLTVNGHVTGDVISFGRHVRINGQVDGNVRAFTNMMTISGTVNKNITNFTESIDLDERAKVGGSVTLFAEAAAFEGKIGRDVLAYFDRLSLSGPVGGGLKLRGKHLTIGPSAEIAGRAVFEQVGRGQPDVSPRAKLSTPLEVKRITRRPDYARASFYIWKLIWTATAFVFGLVMIFLMPKYSEETLASAGRYGASFGLGVLVLIGMPILAVLASATVVGLAIGLTALFLWLAATYATQVFVGAWLGQRLLGPASGATGLVGRMALGLILLRVLTLLPYVGLFFKVVILLWGMGAMSLALYKRLQPPPLASSEPAPAPLPA